MSNITLDFTNVEEKDFSPIPVGKYDVKVDEAEYTISSGGNPMVKLTLVVQNNEQYAGRKLFNNVVIMDKTMWKVKSTFKALGFDVEGSVDLDVSEFVGCEAIAVVGIKEYQGEERNEVKNLLPMDNAVAGAATGGTDAPWK